MIERALLGWGLGGQGIELFGRCETLCLLLNPHLPSFEHVYELHTGEGTLGSVERVEPQHRTCRPLDGSMILLHKIVEIFHLADDGRSAVLLIVAADSRGIGLAAIDGNLLGYPMTIAIKPIDAWRTSEYVACLLATGCSSGSSKRPRDALGVSLPIGSHYV